MPRPASKNKGRNLATEDTEHTEGAVERSTAGPYPGMKPEECRRRWTLRYACYAGYSGQAVDGGQKTVDR